MIVTSRFVFLHLHKSGGTFVNQFLLRFFPEARLIGYHLPRANLPPEFSRLPLFGLVRNPWDYYVSWYSFQAAMREPNVLFRCVSDDGRLDFSATIHNLLSLGEQPKRLARLRAGLPEQFQPRGINLTRRCLEPLVGSDAGFYTFLYRRMYGNDREVRIGRMESLRTEVATLLDSLDVSMTAEMADYLRTGEPANRSIRPRYCERYDDATRDEVARRDAYVIGQYGYRFKSD